MIEDINKKIIEYKKQGNSVKTISDGYHTFEELYYHRMILTKIIAEKYSKYVVKSWKHSDGTMFDNSFIVVFTTKEGQYSYHYNKTYWEMFNIKTVEFAPKYDNHQPEDILRLVSLLEEEN